MKQTIQFVSTAAKAPGSSLPAFTGPAIRTDAVHVVFTSIEETLAAVRAAGDFAKALDVPVELIHFRAISCALSTDEPCGMSPVETEAFLARIRVEGLDVRVRVCLCRDERRAAQVAFKGHSLIVIGGRRSWWPTSSQRVRRMLERAGHFVVFVDPVEYRGHGPLRAPDASTCPEIQEARAGAPRVTHKERSHA